MKNKFKGRIALFVVGGIAMFFAVSGIVMWLWNLLLPEIIGVRVITFWQAMGILVLSKILFGGFGGKGGKKWGRKNCNQFPDEKIHGMSDEEKERLKDLWKKRCEHGGFFRRNQE